MEFAYFTLMLSAPPLAVFEFEIPILNNLLKSGLALGFLE